MPPRKEKVSQAVSRLNATVEFIVSKRNGSPWPKVTLKQPETREVLWVSRSDPSARLDEIILGFSDLEKSDLTEDFIRLLTAGE